MVCAAKRPIKSTFCEKPQAEIYQTTPLMSYEGESVAFHGDFQSRTGRQGARSFAGGTAAVLGARDACGPSRQVDRRSREFIPRRPPSPGAKGDVNRDAHDDADWCAQAAARATRFCNIYLPLNFRVGGRRARVSDLGRKTLPAVVARGRHLSHGQHGEGQGHPGAQRVRLSSPPVSRFSQLRIARSGLRRLQIQCRRETREGRGQALELRRLAVS